MKKLFITLLLFTAMSLSFAQTIVWKQLASLPEGYYSGEAICLNNEIYFAAGRNDKSVTPFFYKFNPKTNQWIKLANIPNPATNLALAAVNGKIYAIGGDRFQNANREYNPQTNTWRILEPMPTARQHIDCGVFGNEIFITGGLTSWKNITTKNEAYDVLSNTWSEKAAIPSLRNNAAVVTLDSLIYVIGGAGTKEDIWGDILTVETYNANSDKWMQKNDLPLLLFKPGAVVVNNEIIVLGGQTRINGKDDCSKKVLIYKAKSDKWIETTPLPEKNVFFGCTSIGNKIYVIGGTVGGNPSWASYTNVYEGELISK
jgi:N-acetylneuraminic acid mutarotase